MNNQIVANKIGVRVSWRVSEYLGQRDDVERMIEKHGLSAALLPKSSLKKAVNRASKKVSKADNGRFQDALPPRKICDRAGLAVYALVDETKVDEEHLTHEQTTTIRLDKTQKRVEATGLNADAFYEEYNIYRTGITDHDIRTFCRAVIRTARGISYNPHGHDYFVPNAYEHLVRNLDAFLKDIFVGKMYITPAIDDDDTLGVTWEFASEQINKEIDDIQKGVQKFSKRAKCLHDKQDALDALKEMAKMYSGMTDRAVLAEDILEKINGTMDGIAKKIEEIEKARAA